MPQFETEILLPFPTQHVFAAITTRKHIERISPPEMGLKFLESPEVYHLDATIRFQVVNFGQVQTITHVVTDFEQGEKFVEKMTDGPVKHWVHEHHVIEHEDGSKVIDRIEFEPPGGLLGFLVTESKIIDSLEEGFSYRERRMREVIGAMADS